MGQHIPTHQPSPSRVVSVRALGRAGALRRHPSQAAAVQPYCHSPCLASASIGTAITSCISSGSNSSSSSSTTTNSRLRRCSRIAATQGGGSGGGGLGDEDVDVAVFRFTLGIPGFDDSLVPRVVGTAVAALVAINHVLGAQPAPPAQVRAEFLDITLAVLCLAAPEIEARLRQVGPGRGRVGAAGQVPGAAQVFALPEGLPDGVRKELAWASFALLKNVNCCSVLLLRPASRAVLLARGAVGASAAAAGNSASTLQALAQGLEPLLSNTSSSSSSSSDGSLAGVLSGAQQQLWLPDAAALQQAGLGGCGAIPDGVQSALVQAAPGGYVLVVLGERPRALSDKDQNWVAAMATKLGQVMQ